MPVREVGTAKARPAGSAAGRSLVGNAQPRKGVSKAFSLAPEPKPTHCAATRAGGWQKCNARPAMGTEYCVGHLRSIDPQRYEIEKQSRGEPQ